MKPVGSVTSRLALRNLTRNLRRTSLSVAGVVIGSTIALLNIGMVKGKIGLFLGNVAEGGVGHLRIVPERWPVSREPSLRLTDWRQELEALRADPEVRVATPHARIQAMLAMGTRLVGVEITGVDPETEPAAYRYVREVETGRYLNASDTHKMVVGRSIADRLRADVGDPIVVTVVDKAGEMKSEMFDLVGIVRVGSEQLENALCQVPLGDIQGLSGLSGAGDITVLLKDARAVPTFSEKRRVPAGDIAMRWDQIMPQARAVIAMNEAIERVMTGILMLVAFLGIAGAQLTAVLERRRELAVLSAIGMGRRKMWSLMLGEGLCLGTLSCIGTLLVAGPIVYYFAAHGLRVLPRSQSISVMGTAFSSVFHGDFGPWFFADAVGLTYGSTFLASLYPAVFAIRLSPADALRVAQ
jgi:ABC-type lipoprotein release transport system permease subunit